MQKPSMLRLNARRLGAFCTPSAVTSLRADRWQHLAALASLTMRPTGPSYWRMPPIASSCCTLLSTASPSCLARTSATWPSARSGAYVVQDHLAGDFLPPLPPHMDAQTPPLPPRRSLSAGANGARRRHGARMLVRADGCRQVMDSSGGGEG